jgi:hypothetical protein
MKQCSRLLPEPQSPICARSSSKNSRGIRGNQSPVPALSANQVRRAPSFRGKTRAYPVACSSATNPLGPLPASAAAPCTLHPLLGRLRRSAAGTPPKIPAPFPLSRAVLQSSIRSETAVRSRYRHLLVAVFRASGPAPPLFSGTQRSAVCLDSPPAPAFSLA